jgi:hypothetical protein
MRIQWWISFLLSCGILTAVVMLIYATVQQNYRQNANDPQVKMAMEIRDRLSEGRSVESFFSGDTVDLSRSLDVFSSLYNAKGEAIRSSGLLDGKLPKLPDGVFDFVRQHGEERVTWQPRASVRMAMVLLRTGTPTVGFIGVGRSLKEVEVREGNLLRMVFSCWVIVMILAGMIALLWVRISRRMTQKN